MTHGDPHPPPPPPASFLQTLGAVFWSFLGIRKGHDMRRDSRSMNPVHVIIAGVAMAALLVIALVFVVRTIVR